MTFSLASFLSGEIFAFMLVFTRVAAAMMVFPGFGDSYVPRMLRLAVGFGLVLAVLPALTPLLPEAPTSPAGIMRLLLLETLFGLFLGLIARTLMSTLETVGMILSIKIGLSGAQVFNPAIAGNSTLIGALLGTTGTVLFFLTNLHHLLLRVVVESYQLYAPGTAFPAQDTAYAFAAIVAESFLLGVQLAMPFIVIGTAFFFVLGLLTKLAPQIQAFFVGLPAQIALGLHMMAVTLSTMMLLWLDHFADAFNRLPSLF